MCWGGDPPRAFAICVRAFGEPRKAIASQTQRPGTTPGAGFVLPAKRQTIKCLEVPLLRLPDPRRAQGPSLLQVNSRKIRHPAEEPLPTFTKGPGHCPALAGLPARANLSGAPRTTSPLQQPRAAGVPPPRAPVASLARAASPQRAR